MAAATCNVCVSPYNKTTRKEVTCGHCAFSGCRDCQKRYILGTVNQPHCMSCKVPWNSEFIVANFTKKFFNEDLAAHRANAMFESEKALMPQTQERLRRMNAVQEVVAFGRMVAFYTTQVKKPAEAEFYRKKIADIRDEMPDIEIDGAAVGPSRRRDAEAAPKPVCGCIRDDCRGFIMNNNWKCGLCDTKVCHDCLKEKVDGHECTDEDKETRKLLLRNTKPCPKCAVMISKTEGCSQMWCIMCHTTFDWHTGEIVKGYVHNPHYFEWARRNGHQIERAPGDAPRPRPDAPAEPPACREQLPNARSFMHAINRHYNSLANDSHSQMIINLYQIRNHVNDVLRRQLRDPNYEGMREELRMKYLSGELTEEEYKADLVKAERKGERKRAEWNIADLFLAQATETLLFIYNNKPADVFRTHLCVIVELVRYCNDEFKKTARAYRGSTWYEINLTNGYVHSMR